MAPPANVFEQKRKIAGPETDATVVETRCCKVLFPNCSKEKSAEDALVPPLSEKRGKYVCFFNFICTRGCTRRDLCFHVDIYQHAHQELLTRR